YANACSSLDAVCAEPTARFQSTANAVLCVPPSVPRSVRPYQPCANAWYAPLAVCAWPTMTCPNIAMSLADAVLPPIVPRSATLNCGADCVGTSARHNATTEQTSAMRTPSGIDLRP